MPELCVACGKPITTVRASRHVITLERVWVRTFADPPCPACPSHREDTP